MAAGRHSSEAAPDAWLGVPTQLAIRDLAAVCGYGGSLSARRLRRVVDSGGRTVSATASMLVAARGLTLLCRPLSFMDPHSFTALFSDREGNVLWQEDAERPSYYEAYDLVRRAFARLRLAERAGDGRTDNHINA